MDPLRPISLELRHLRLMLAIDEQGGITRAGERLHLTQSALSHQLQEIESRLGVPLFLRVKKRLVLTAAGRRVVESARPLLERVVALEDELRGHAAGRRGLLRLTTECYTVYDWLPPLLGRFAERFPGVEVRIVADATRRPLEALADGEVDLAIVTGEASDPGIRLTPLFEDELLLGVAATHPLARREWVEPGDLAGERLLLYGTAEQSKFYQRFLAAVAVTPREVMGVQLTEAMLSMVEAGFGVAPFAAWAIARHLERGTIVGVRLGQQGLARTWSAATRDAEREPAFLAEFAALVAARAAPGRSLAPPLRMAR